MGRILIGAASVLAIGTVLAEALAAGLLWSQGRLTSQTVAEIRSILRDPSELVAEEQNAEETPRVSLDDVIARRAQRIIDIEGREQEQSVLQALVDDARDSVLKDQEAVQAERENFEQQQEARKKQEMAASVQRSRNVLLKLEPATAIQQLMQLPLTQNVLIMQGMPEKNIAEMLQAFSGGDKQQEARGQEIFQAITRGKLPETEPGDAP